MHCLSSVMCQTNCRQWTSPEAFLHLSGQALVSAFTVVSFGMYAIKMAVPNKICTVQTYWDMSDSKAVKIHVTKLGTWQMLGEKKKRLMTARLSDYSIIKRYFFLV